MSNTASALEAFQFWKRQEVTQAVFADLHNRLVVLTEELQEQAGLNPLEDRFKVGYITAIKDVLQVTFEEIELND